LIIILKWFKNETDAAIRWYALIAGDKRLKSKRWWPPTSKIVFKKLNKLFLI